MASSSINWAQCSGIFYSWENERVGPVSFTELVEAYQAGKILPETFVFDGESGWSDWKLLGECEGLVEALAEASSAGSMYYVEINGEIGGPFTMGQMAGLMEKKELTAKTLIFPAFESSWTEWEPLGKHSDLVSELNEVVDLEPEDEDLFYVVIDGTPSEALPIPDVVQLFRDNPTLNYDTLVFNAKGDYEDWRKVSDEPKLAEQVYDIISKRPPPSPAGESSGSDGELDNALDLSESEFYVDAPLNSNGEPSDPLGPFSVDTLRTMYHTKAIDGSTHVLRVGEEEWIPVYKVLGLMALLKEGMEAKGPVGSAGDWGIMLEDEEKIVSMDDIREMVAAGAGFTLRTRCREYTESGPSPWKYAEEYPPIAELFVAVMAAAAIEVQRVYRGHAAKVKMAKRKDSAVKIQARYRGHLTRKNLKQAPPLPDITQDDAATRVQSLYRGHRARKSIVLQEEAATKVQSLYRGHLVRRPPPLPPMDEDTAAKHVQSAYRGYAARKSVAAQKEIRANAAVKLQSVQRGRRARGEYREAKKQDRAARMIQSEYKGHAEAKRRKRLQERAATDLQRVQRGRMVRKKRREESTAAVMIQAGFRSHKQRKEYRVMKEQDTAARKIQTVQRQRLHAKETRRREAAAQVIQGRYRVHYKKREEERERELVILTKSVILIQGMFRRAKARQDVRNLIRRRKEAAVRIQALFRARKASSVFHLCLSLEKKKKLRQEKAKMMSPEERAVMTIQRVVRARRARKEVSALRDEKEELERATLAIQTRFRGFLSRRIVENKREEDIKFKAVRRLQANYRGMLGRRLYEIKRLEWEQTRNGAATYVQLAFRRKLARRRLAQAFTEGRIKCKEDREQDSALIIQLAWRCSLAREVAKGRRQAAKLIQRWYRYVCGQMRVLIKKRRSCCLIQRIFRGHLARRLAMKIRWLQGSVHMVPLWKMVRVCAECYQCPLIHDSETMIHKAVDICQCCILEKQEGVRRHDSCCSAMEEALEKAKNAPESIVFQLASELVSLYNFFAQKFIIEERNGQAVEMLEKARAFTDPDGLDWPTRLELRAWTFDLLAMYFYRKNKLRAAHIYARNSYKCAKSAPKRHLVTASLHLAAVLARIGKNEESCEYIDKARNLLQGFLQSMDYNIQELMHRIINSHRPPSMQDEELMATVKEINCMIAICHNNMAIQFVNMTHFRAARAACKESFKLIKENMCRQHPWVRHFAKTYQLVAQPPASLLNRRQLHIWPVWISTNMYEASMVVHKGRDCKETDHPEKKKQENIAPPALSPGNSNPASPRDSTLIDLSVQSPAMSSIRASQSSLKPLGPRTIYGINSQGLYSSPSGGKKGARPASAGMARAKGGVRPSQRPSTASTTRKSAYAPSSRPTSASTTKTGMSVGVHYSALKQEGSSKSRPASAGTTFSVAWSDALPAIN